MEKKMDNNTKDLLILVLVVIIWYGANRWILPKFGIST